MKKKLLIALVGCITILVVFLMMIVVPLNPPKSDLETKTGIVSRINFNNDTKDIDIFLGDKISYHINRGLEKGIDKDSLQHAIAGKPVKITYYEMRFDLMAMITKRKSRHVFNIESATGSGL